METLERLELLSAMGCDMMRGYFIGHPVPAEQITANVGRQIAHPVSRKRG